MLHNIAIDNTILPITIRKHPRARHMVIRYQPLTHSLTLTLPRYVSRAQGLSFIKEKREWIAEQLGKRITHISYEDGQKLAILGQQITIIHQGGRGVIRLAGDELLVPGDVEFLPRRVREWLKKKAKEEVTLLARSKAAQLQKPIGKITLRDTSSHWGSCTQSGNISFSWRLIFAPYAVMDYVVCHEVAHLVELNHSPAFWREVARLCPDYEQHKTWLKEHGSDLYRYI